MRLPARHVLADLSPAQVQARLAEIGQPLSDEQFEFVWVAASIMIGERTGDRTCLGGVARAIGGVVATPAAEDEGGRPLLENLVPSRWPYPEARYGTRGWSMAKNALDFLDLSDEDLDDLYAAAQLCGGSKPKLPLGIVCAFFAPPMLAAIWAVASVGVLRAQQLLKRYLLAKSLSVAAAGARKGQRLSQEALAQYETDFRALMLVLHQQMYPSFRFADEDPEKPPTGVLAGWHTLPPCLKHKTFKAPRAKTDRTAPEHIELRRAVVQARREQKAAPDNKRLRKTVESLALDLFVELGGRVGAVIRIARTDFIEFYPPFNGPAVRLQPKKGAGPTDYSYKPISRDLYDRAQDYLQWAGLNSLPPRTIWVDGWSPGGVGHPLPAANHKAVEQQLRRSIKRGLGEKPPHTVRHAISQYATAATREYVEANRDSDPRLGRISYEVGARALLDQAFDKLDKLGYGDLEADREKFSLIVWKGIRRAVYSEEGARRAPDWSRIEGARLQRDIAQRTFDAAARAVDLLHERRRQLELGAESEASAATAPPESEEEDVAAGLALLVAEVRSLRDALEAERRKRRDLTSVAHELDDAKEAKQKAKRALDTAETELELATESRVPVSDSLSDEEYEALCAQPPRWSPTLQEEQPEEERYVRAWVSTGELARASGRSEATARNYMAGRTPCPWWDAEDIPRIVHGSGRIRAVAIFEIDPKRVSPIMWERLIAFCKQRAPRWYASFALPPQIATSGPPVAAAADEEPTAEQPQQLAA